jgi:ATP-dependent NAD(P)H-hydrate dehydratase
MVIDADGLHLITNKPNIIINYDRSVLTPNDIEFVRLFQRVFGHAPSKEDGSKADQTKQLALKMGGVTILCKGYHDIISNGTEVFICDEEGSPKRQGGQGDLLSGSLGLLLHWSRSVHERCEKPIIPHSIVAAYASSMLVKKCACITYGRLGRGMLTSDMVTDISTAAQQIFNDGGTNA